MKRYMIKQTLILGYVDIPDGRDVSEYLDENDCWPDDEVVAGCDFIEVNEANEPIEAPETEPKPVATQNPTRARILSDSMSEPYQKGSIHKIVCVVPKTTYSRGGYGLEHMSGGSIFFFSNELELLP